MLRDKHKKEILSSVPQTELGERITSLNFSSVDSHEIPRLMNWGDTSKWKQRNVGDGWMVSGVDPKDGQPTMLGVQVKTDTPTTGSDGKPVKYLSALGYPSEPIFLDTGDSDYWKTVQSEPFQWRWIAEGAKKAACLMALGQPAISLPGVDNWGVKGTIKGRLLPFIKGARVALCFDMDWQMGRDGKPNLNVLRAVTRLAREVIKQGGIPAIVHWDVTKGKGIDDFLMQVPESDREMVVEGLLEQSWNLQQFLDNTKSLDQSKDDDCKIKWTPGLYLFHKIEQILGAEKEDFIAVLGSLHQWTGTHYALLPDDKALSLIQSAFSKYSYESKGQIVYPFAKTGEVKEALAYLKQLRAIAIEELPKSGVPLANGVLEVSYESGQPEFELVEHDRSRYYLHCSEVEYDPSADPTDCDRMLGAIMPEQVQTWLEHQSLRFNFIVNAEKFGRPRAAFHEGTGSNGKDVCRLSIRDLFPEMAGFTLSDFQQYEDGRKFGLATLPKYGLSWSSENSHKIKLDNLKSLINAIAGTGQLDSEFKNRDSVQYDPLCIFHFNVNKAPLMGHAEFLATRFAIYTYPFTFSSSGEDGKLKADERFAYNHPWRKKNVSTSLLNKLIEAHKAAWSRGKINWASTTDRMRRWAQDSNHILQFCDDTGLVAGTLTDVIEVGEAWGLLEDWYLEKNLLKNDPTTGRDWASDPSNFDILVRKPQDLFARLQGIFPNLQKSRCSKTRRALICGLKKVEPVKKSESEAWSEARNGDSEARNGHDSGSQTQSYQDSQNSPKLANHDSLLNQDKNKDHVYVHDAHTHINKKEFSIHGSQDSSNAESVAGQGVEDYTPPKNHASDAGSMLQTMLQVAPFPLGSRILFPAPGTTQLIEGVVDQIRVNPIYPDRLQYHCQNGSQDDWCEVTDLQRQE